MTASSGLKALEGWKAVLDTLAWEMELGVVAWISYTINNMPHILPILPQEELRIADRLLCGT